MSYSKLLEGMFGYLIVRKKPANTDFMILALPLGDVYRASILGGYQENVLTVERIARVSPHSRVHVMFCVAGFRPIAVKLRGQKPFKERWPGAFFVLYYR